MSHSDTPGIDSPPLPAVCQWTARLILLPMFFLLLAGPAVVILFDQPDFMATPGMLFAFGVLILGLAASLLGWHKTWTERTLRRLKRAPSWVRMYPIVFGLLCVANGIALLVGSYCQL